jgi:hypothetical protein
MTVNDLLKEYPAGYFLSDATTDFLSSDYANDIKSKFSLTDYEISLINKHGFMVSERLNYYTFIHAFWDIYQKDMPVYISTDAILHALHFSFNGILRDIEKYGLAVRLDTAVNMMKIDLSKRKIENSPEIFNKAINDLDVYLTVTQNLLTGLNISCVNPKNDSVVTELNKLISELIPAKYSLFSDTKRLIDFSQFTPRGHYTIDSNFTRYFKAMIWLGRTEIFISNPENEFSLEFKDKELQRMAILSALIAETAVKSGANKYLSSNERIYSFLIGKQDNITLDDVVKIMNEMSITPIDLCDTSICKQYQEKLINIATSQQLYNSQILYSDISSPEQVKFPSVFLLMGQRPIIDGFITDNVVFDRILFKGGKVLRVMPSTQDVLFSLGNDASVQLLDRELNKYPYSSNLAALRYLINSYDENFWKSSVYTYWLNSIRLLNPPLSRGNLPLFMQTAAWWQKTMSTQLASWAELRHDFLLYAKQPYTESYLCTYPSGFVEPNPQFYKNCGEFFSKLKEIVEVEFENIPLNYEFNSFVEKWTKSCDTLSQISERILNKQEFTKEQNSFISSVISYNQLCQYPPRTPGWYPKLYYNFSDTDFKFYSEDPEYRLASDDFITADVHTIPMDENENDVGWVLHAGTGRINLAVITTNKPDSNSRSYIGPVYSYYEFVSNDFKRLTDQEWQKMDGAPAYRPEFTNLYLADKTGSNPKGEKLSLYTVQSSVAEKPAESNSIEIKCSPNPFTNNTVFTFVIDRNFSEKLIEFSIYDINGNIIKSLFKQKLPENVYSIVWDGTNTQNQKLNSGTYIYSLKAGDIISSGKIEIIR